MRYYLFNAICKCDIKHNCTELIHFFVTIFFPLVHLGTHTDLLTYWSGNFLAVPKLLPGYVDTACGIIGIYYVQRAAWKWSGPCGSI